MPLRRRETLLVADDDSAIRNNLALFLRAEGYDVREAADGVEAGAILSDPAVALGLVDLKMPRRDGIEVLRGHAERLEEAPVIVITAYGGSGPAIEAMRLGAYDYITKPFDLDEVLFTIRRALTQRSLAEQVMALSVDPAEEDLGEDELVGRTPGMLAVFKLIGRVAATEEPVLVTGESGTGKELVATAIHRNSLRSGGAFVKVNVAALSPTLLESELFGHEKGAFSGAVAARRGRFEQADGGTIFLDEIGELDIDLQAKLLRVLQSREFERVGGEATLRTDVRLVAATNRDLRERMREGRFREDLYYRINVMPIDLPPLRDRRDDIPPLAAVAIRKLSQKYRWPNLGLTPDAQDELARRPWPGNVRELQNILARAAILAGGGTIQPCDLESPAVDAAASPALAGSLVLRDALAETERRLIRLALEQEKWNRTQAARVLGISRRQLFDKIRRYGIEEG